MVVVVLAEAAVLVVVVVVTALSQEEGDNARSGVWSGLVLMALQFDYWILGISNCIISTIRSCSYNRLSQWLNIGIVELVGVFDADSLC